MNFKVLFLTVGLMSTVSVYSMNKDFSDMTEEEQEEYILGQNQDANNLSDFSPFETPEKKSNSNDALYTSGKKIKKKNNAVRPIRRRVVRNIVPALYNSYNGPHGPNQ